jgi:hypothetical protein
MLLFTIFRLQDDCTGLRTRFHIVKHMPTIWLLRKRKYYEHEGAVSVENLEGFATYTYEDAEK